MEPFLRNYVDVKLDKPVPLQDDNPPVYLNPSGLYAPPSPNSSPIADEASIYQTDPFTGSLMELSIDSEADIVAECLRGIAINRSLVDIPASSIKQAVFFLVTKQTARRYESGHWSI